MFSFLNGKSPFDEAEEKLEAGEVVNGRPKLPTAPVMGWQDGVFLLVVVALIFGGYQYYQHAKKSSAETFARCDALYIAAAETPDSYLAAEACYDSTWNLAFVSDSMEILRQKRLEEIDDKRQQMKALYEQVLDAISENNTAKAVQMVNDYKGAMFLRKDDQEKWKEIGEMKVEEPKDSTVKAEEATK